MSSSQNPEFADTERLDPSRSGSRRASRSGARRSAVRLGSLPRDSEEDVRFVQDRMALFAKVTFLISLMFLVATSAADLAAHVDRYSMTSRLFHFVGTVIALGVWLAARGQRSLAPGVLHALDIAATLGLCWSFATMGHFGMQPYTYYVGMLAVTHVSIARAMIVPSVPMRTLLLAAFGFGAFVLSRGLLPLPPEMLEIPNARFRGVLESFLWATAGTAVSTVASTVIYGLHERARAARQLGQYALEEKIGEGGMGEVYRARHAMLRRPTAVKLLAGDGSEHQLRRFEKEVQLTARLTHPNTISVYDYGRTPEGIFYYAMELLDGMTLEQLVNRHGPQPPGRVIHILTQVCGALAEAHGVGLIHRDIKPANIHLCRRGDIPDFVKVLDFGLVREVKNDGSVSRSNLNVVVGTPLYLSPEAILTPDTIDARADIYALGCVAYFLATGHTPFHAKSIVELCAHHLHSVPPPPSERHALPQDLERVILACLEKKPEQRPASARALAELLAGCQDAGTWTQADADAWWADSDRPDTTRAAPPPISVEQPRRTVCCVDLEKRLAETEATGS